MGTFRIQELANGDFGVQNKFKNRGVVDDDEMMNEDLTKAMKATQSPIPMKSIRAQWPVSTHTQTT